MCINAVTITLSTSLAARMKFFCDNSDGGGGGSREVPGAEAEA